MRWERVAYLSEQHLELLRLANEHGTESKVIACHSDYAPTTVDTYMSQIRRALGVQTRQAAVRLAETWNEQSRDSRTRLRELAGTARNLDEFEQAVASLDDDREDGGGQLLREERILFEVRTPPKPWWHPVRWGSDVDLSTREILFSILALTVGIAVVWYLVVSGAAPLQQAIN